MSDKVELRPTRCPRCRRPAYFAYTSKEEAERGSPICWGVSERDCPGWMEETPLVRLSPSSPASNGSLTKENP